VLGIDYGLVILKVLGVWIWFGNIQEIIFDFFSKKTQKV